MVKNGESGEIAEIDQLLARQVIAARVAQAAVAGYARYVSADERSGQLGAAGTLSAGRPVTRDTPFDLASVSKPIVACALMRLVQRDICSLDSPLGQLLPEARGTASEHLRLELLLAHRAGLAAHRPLFAPVLAGAPFRRSAALRAAADARRDDCPGEPGPEGFAPLYSDLGYLLIGAAIEALTALPLDRVVADEVAQPLGLELGSARQWRSWRASFEHDVAPTEVVPARGGLLRGVVHDENAWALSGHGCSGHAGLFGTAPALLGFGVTLLSALAGRSTWLARDALLVLVRPRPGGTLRAGFDGKSSEGSSAGALSGSETFGHLGFTGTSLWCDPSAGVASVLLTNRVCPSRDNPRIKQARPLVHDALFRASRGTTAFVGQRKT